MPHRTKLILLSAHYPPDPSGVGDYTHFLGNALARLGWHVEIVTSVGTSDTEGYPLAPGAHVHRVIKSWSVGHLTELLRVLRSFRPSAVIIQYVPHSFSRSGITLGPCLLPLLVRLTTQHRVIVNFHEICIPFSRSWKLILGSLWQRGTAALMAFPAHAVSVVTGQWRELLHSIGVRKPVTVIPVGSNIPLAPFDAEERRALRNSLGVEDGLLLGCFGSLNGRDEPLVLRAFATVRQRCRATLLWLGEVARTPSLPRSQDIVWTGRLPHGELSRHLSACDLFVLPLRDGVSSRRTTVAAALHHGLPVLTTKGPATDELFLVDAPMLLIPVDDVDAFVAALDRLVQDAKLRRRLASEAITFHDSHFQWDGIARQVAHLVMGLGADG